jgi:hypothetical protein
MVQQTLKEVFGAALAGADHRAAKLSVAAARIRREIIGRYSG